jgi:hypothetical protein
MEGKDQGIAKLPQREVRSVYREENKENSDGTRWKARNKIRLGRNLPDQWKKRVVAFSNALALEYLVDDCLDR